jgi:hypothetical protein
VVDCREDVKDDNAAYASSINGKQTAERSSTGEKTGIGNR